MTSPMRRPKKRLIRSRVQASLMPPFKMFVFNLQYPLITLRYLKQNKMVTDRACSIAKVRES